ncbi:MAG: peptide ABC transporter substrate-binding protein [Clostridia bacterium]|nr:peptide ABC transporter substrate-binding protein [Clostridia bacterium]
MKKLLALTLAVFMLFSLTACGGNNKDTEALSVCLASEPDSIDPALNSTVDGATMLAHLFAGLAKWAEDENGELVIVADAALELPEGVINTDGTVTYTYKLREDLKWSDGKKVTASDFVFAWNRAASPELAGDYNYLFDVIVGYAEMWETDEGGNYINPDAELAVRAIDNSTLEVTLTNTVSYWNELIAFPTFYPVREDIVANDGWSTQAETYVSNGPYKLASWEHNSLITMSKNDDYYDAESVTMLTLKFYLSDNANNMLTNFRNGDWLLIESVPTNEFSALKETYESEFSVNEQLGTYYLCWNINENLLPETADYNSIEAGKAMAEVRKAISLLIDRNYIVNNITHANETPASTFVPKGLTNPDGTQFYQTSGNSDQYFGYYNVSPDAFETNYQQAINTLKKYYTFDETTGMFTDVPTITYIYNTNDNHQAIGEYVQGALAAVGINVELNNQEWNTFLNTRKEGEYTIARNGWIADYNYPLSFLDMFTSTSGNNDVQLGKAGHKNLNIYSIDLTDYGIDYKANNASWSATYDVLISEIKATNDTELRFELMHLAEDMLMETGCITPLYYYTDVYMISDRVNGFYCNPLGYKYFMHTTIDKE